MIVFNQNLFYDHPEEDPHPLGIYLEDSTNLETEIDYKCSYSATSTATSELLTVNAATDASGAVEAADVVNWGSNFNLAYFSDATFGTVKTADFFLGVPFYAQLTWDTATKPNNAMFNNVQYYITKCSVQNDNDDYFDIIYDTCYADIISVKNLNPNQERFTLEHSQMSYTSFLFKNSPNFTQ